ncbi:TonB-dependent receptor [Alteromonas sp. 1_MG-2023]|uniref:TonB-dependent receptor domain-containing protein n=1 Tax=Alteromonas sp. 1_MG-2023 TaxID=3062669 RepID=UPI0026E4761A|nr:TonB-dependent receptor [Alteromonas sp. 1_MG-2023]MDO6477585.1 TonB-dependent receptor [Alteromonas sp. 1_MG-2023]
MFENTRLAKSVKLACAFGAVTAASMTSNGAFAQEEATADGEKVEKIQVTGSRIRRTDIESSSPVQITSDVEIKLSGFTRVEDLLNSLPQIEAGQTAFQANGASGTASVDLRGLGPSRTLVLVNGRRLQPGGVYSQSADINQIPAGLVKRVEVLTGGASTTYGADAVAGVVNFVMDTDFEGFEFTAGAQGYQHDNSNEYIQGLMDQRDFEYPTGSSGIDGTSFNYDLAIGGSFDGGKGHAVAYATYRRDNELRQGARDYSSCALNAAGTACGGSGNAEVPNFYLGAVDDAGDFLWSDDPDFNQYFTLDSNSNFIDSVGNSYNYAPINHFMRPDERYSIGAFVNYEVNEHFNPYMETMFMRDVTRAQIAESGTFFAETYLIDYDSDLINDSQREFLTDTFGITSGQQFATYIGKRNTEGGPRSSNLEHNSLRMVVGTRGAINDMWEYDVSAQYGTTGSSAAYVNDFYLENIAAALSPDCEDDCIPYEVFTYQGITSEAASTLTGTAILNGETAETIVNGYVSGEFDYTLPSADAPIAAVFGAEYRKEEFSRTSDTVFATGALAGQGGPTPSIYGSYSVKELFTELSVPVLESLTLDLGYRYSDYSTSGGTDTYKIAGEFQVNDDWMIRANYNRAVRAPNVANLFTPQELGLWSGVDPCAGATPEYSEAQCALTGVTSAQYGNVVASPASQYNDYTGGNPNLDPEVADTYGLGVVANPIENLNFSVDYWLIEMEDVIGTVGSELTVRQCALTGSATFCDNVVRSGSGSLWLGTEGYVAATNINLAGRTWEGIDLDANYELEVGEGTITTRLIGTYFLTKEYDTIPGVTEAYDCSGEISTDCFAQPEWRHTLTVSYTTGDFWSLQAKWRYYGEVNYSGTTDTLLADGISAQSYLDLKGTFDVNDHVGVLIGVNNVLDKEPPLVGGSLSSNGNAVAGFYDTLGRFLHASVTVRY